MAVEFHGLYYTRLERWNIKLALDKRTTTVNQPRKNIPHASFGVYKATEGSTNNDTL